MGLVLHCVASFFFSKSGPRSGIDILKRGAPELLLTPLYLSESLLVEAKMRRINPKQTFPPLVEPAPPPSPVPVRPPRRPYAIPHTHVVEMKTCVLSGCPSYDAKDHETQRAASGNRCSAQGGHSRLDRQRRMRQNTQRPPLTSPNNQ